MHILKIFLFFTCLKYSYQQLNTCTITTNVLTVPSEGCQLQSKRKELQFQKIILNGVLQIQQEIQIKYKSLEIGTNARLKLTSKDTLLSFEDISQDTCVDFEQGGFQKNVISLSYESYYKIQLYNFESVQNEDELTIINKSPFQIREGVKVAIISISGSTEYSFVESVQGQKVKLKSKLQNTYLYETANTYEVGRVKLYPYIILLDTNSVHFKKTCLNLQITKGINGIVLEDVKGMRIDGGAIADLDQSNYLIFDNQIDKNFKRIYIYSYRQNNFALVNLQRKIRIVSKYPIQNFFITDVISQEFCIFWKNSREQKRLKYSTIINSQIRFIHDDLENEVLELSYSDILNSSLKISSVIDQQSEENKRYLKILNSSIVNLDLSSDILKESINFEIRYSFIKGIQVDLGKSKSKSLKFSDNFIESSNKSDFNNFLTKSKAQYEKSNFYNDQNSTQLKCQYGFSILTQSCYQLCPEGQYKIKDKCLSTEGVEKYIDYKNYQCQKGFKKVSGECQRAKGDYCDGDQCYDTKNCFEGMFLLTEKYLCSLCIEGCKTCQNSNECQICYDEFLLKNQKCFCPPAQYLKQGVCEKCSKNNCTLCTDENNCLQCEQGFKLFQNDCLKKCEIGDYLNEKSGKCEKCDTNCQECKNTPNQCTSCKDDTFHLKENKCILCNQLIPLCKKCSSENACDLCEVNAVFDSKKCECPPAQFYEQIDKKCKNCSGGCLKCSSENYCSSCLSGYQLFKNNCLKNCEIGDYLNEKSGKCEKCDANCKECKNTPNQCTSCKDDTFYIKENKCVLCNELIPLCKKCSSENTCDLCELNLIFDSKKCECPPAQFYDQIDKKCKNCQGGCLKCSSENYCTSCLSGYQLFKNNCLKKCEIGDYLNEKSGKCEKCNANCQECKNTPSQCTSCKDDTFYLKENKCVLCNELIPLCKKCSSENTCDLCEINATFNSKNCECPPAQFYEQIDKKCKNCSGGCLKCSSENYCTSCLSGYFLEQTKCKQCKSSEFSQNGDNKCYKCDESCLECRSQFSCLVCKSKEYEIIDSKCIKKKNNDNINTQTQTIDNGGTPAKDESDKNLTDAEIAGIVLGFIFLLLIIGFIVFIKNKRSKAQIGTENTYNFFVNNVVNKNNIISQNDLKYDVVQEQLKSTQSVI